MSPPEEMVTVVDPRHPLFGRTLPCLGIANSSHRGRCCIVWIRPTIERHVPVTATNLEYDPTTLYPLPISVSALRQFLQEYTLVSGGRKGEPANDAETTNGPEARGEPVLSDPAQSTLGNAHYRAAHLRGPGDYHDVSGMSHAHRGDQK
jgi:hypothetical protein